MDVSEMALWLEWMRLKAKKSGVDGKSARRQMR
jgi:hypothetical protein